MILPRTTYSVILGGALAWCIALILPALLVNTSWMSEFIYRSFHSICHQLPERSFHVFGGKLAVCSRCSSIYFAFLLGVVLYPFICNLTNTLTPHRNALLIVMLLVLIDVGLDFIGIHESTYLTRTITGIILGSVVPFFVLPAAIEAVQQLSTPKPITINEHQKGISNARKT